MGVNETTNGFTAYEGSEVEHEQQGNPMTTPLLPDRHPTADFFVCGIFDALPKDDLASMEHPLFSLSTRPDLSVLNYVHNDVTVEVTPSV